MRHFIFCWPCISLQILDNNQLDGLFHVFIYFISLHVSSIIALIIRRSNCINTSSGMISLCKWLLGMSVRRELQFPPDGHTKQSLTQTNHTRWCIKGGFLDHFQHWGHLAYCILAPKKFPHSSPEVPRIIQMLETSTSEGGNYYQILLANSNLRKYDFLHAAKLGQILLLPLRRKAYWGFSGHPKNPTASARVWTRELGFQWPVC